MLLDAQTMDNFIITIYYGFVTRRSKGEMPKVRAKTQTNVSLVERTLIFLVN